MDTGNGREPLQIVCGAKNARTGLVTALAMVGAQLPGKVTIGAARLRGVESSGMLCSAKELGLSETADGIIELPGDAPLGTPLREYLRLDSPILELNVTPNRGDAMSVLGVAREVSALCGVKISGPALQPVPARSAATVEVRLEAPRACPRFAGRVIRGLRTDAVTPSWLRERLRRAGLRPISPVVDVTNFVMLELGQPLHAYDLARLRGGIAVRLARAAERCTLLDGREVELANDVLVIADDRGPLALAGIMGGAASAVAATTTDVFLEVAWFVPAAIAGRARRFGLTTDASQRFERGVDPQGVARAVERATALIVAIAGGEPGPTVITESGDHDLPAPRALVLRTASVKRFLGMEIAPERVTLLLSSLGMACQAVDGGLQVQIPSYRFDLVIERDLIEEIARMVGYDAIPTADARITQRLMPERASAGRSVDRQTPLEIRWLDTLAARGYHEAITFAFVDPLLQRQLFPDCEGVALTNPIASDMAEMRLSLWPGLIKAALENQRRQQERVRLFELGVVFAPSTTGPVESGRIAVLAMGSRWSEQWGLARDAVDFHDLRRDGEALLSLAGAGPDEFKWVAASLSCLHPGKTARIERSGVPVGWIGELHPQLVRDLGFVAPPILLELDTATALSVKSAAVFEVSRFPQVRRDLAVIVDEEVSFSAVAERVILLSSGVLRDVRVFDIYRGAGVEKGRKSLALGLIFQENSRTLTDAETDSLMAKIRADLSAGLNATIRE